MIKWNFRIAALALCAISATYTVLLCVKFADTPFLIGITAATGLALELMKFSLFPAAQTLWRRRRYIIAIVCYALGTTLVAVSFSASTAFFSEADSAKSAQQLSQNLDFKMWREQVSAVGERISLLQESASKDLRNGYRARANSTLAKLREVERQRSDLLAGRPESTASSTLPIRPKLIFGTLATLIELCAIAALMLPSLLQDRELANMSRTVNVKPESGGGHPTAAVDKKLYKTLPPTSDSPTDQLMLHI